MNKKYLVCCTEALYYGAKEVTAATKEEAEEKFWELWDAGMVAVNDSEIVKLDVDEMPQ